MISLKQVARSIVISSSITSIFLPQVASAQSVGKIECGAVSTSNSSMNAGYKITKATLSKNSGGGYTFKMRLAGRSDDIVYPVTSNLKVQKAIYAGQDSDLELQPNGKFSFTQMPTGRKVCGVKGTLTFGAGVKQKIFGK
jgi:hypothetical protein